MSQFDDIFKLLVEFPSSNPLSETTRKERSFLLATSLIAVAITWGGITPEKISAFGFDINKLEQKNLLLLICSIIIYFLAGFLIYGIPEYLQSQVKEQNYRERIGRLLNENLGNSEDGSLAFAVG